MYSTKQRVFSVPTITVFVVAPLSLMHNVPNHKMGTGYDALFHKILPAQTGLVNY